MPCIRLVAATLVGTLLLACSPYEDPFALDRHPGARIAGDMPQVGVFDGTGTSAGYAEEGYTEIEVEVRDADGNWAMVLVYALTDLSVVDDPSALVLGCSEAPGSAAMYDEAATTSSLTFVPIELANGAEALQVDVEATFGDRHALNGSGIIDR